MSREEQAFLSKYGMATYRAAAAAAAAAPAFDGSRWQFVLTRFIVDPDSNGAYYWALVFALAYFYNLLFIVFRCVFLPTSAEVDRAAIVLFACLDVLTDAIYLADMLVKARTGFLESGLLVRDVRKTWWRYRRSAALRVDILSALPFDYALEIALGTANPALRFNRLLRVQQLSFALNATETRVARPIILRVSCVIMYVFLLIHWNACVYFQLSQLCGLGSDTWAYGEKNVQSLPPGVRDTLWRRYVYSFYWSTLQLTTVGEVPGPVTNIEFVFVTLNVMTGVLIFASVVGTVGSMIANASASRVDFQNNITGVKKYMRKRHIGKELEQRVFKWFEYLWSNKQSVTDQQVLQVLPSKLQAEIAMSVHFETLRKVRIFQDCESGLLAELVLKLQLQVFSPGDWVCRKGDIGREMYIVKRGRLQVVADDGEKVFHTLSEGAVFGELSILNIPGSKQGNRRSASIRSRGYTDCFVLNKSDLWDALREFPDAQTLLIQKGREILLKDNLLDENAAAESKSADELVAELQRLVGDLQTRLARLTAERVSCETKLRSRLEYLEQQLERHGDEGFYDDDAPHS